LAERRRVVILRRKSWSREEEEAFRKLALLGHDVETIRHGPRASRSITNALRDGAIAILLYDLPYRWGKTSEVKIFNHTCHWVIGPLQLAMLGRATVVPFYTYSVDQHCYCDLSEIRDYRSIGGNRISLLHKETQIMATIAERYIRNHVIQWDHWNLIPEMLQREDYD